MTCMRMWGDTISRLFKFIVICSLVMGILGCIRANAQDMLVQRIWGSDRYSTAAAISKEGWQSSEYVILARGDDFPDALCAAPLAGMYEAPLLLTEPQRLNHETLSEIIRLKTVHVIIIGGPGAVSPGIEDELKSIGVKIIERIYGNDRYETSLRIAEKLPGCSRIALATGSDYPDALSISSIAARLGMPVILTHKDSLDEGAAGFINESKIAMTYIIGGEGVIDGAVESLVPSPIRLGGLDRYGTNVRVLKEFEDVLDFSGIYAASGEGPYGDEFADALAGSVLASKKASPLVLVGGSVPDVVWDYLLQKTFPESRFTILGGMGAVNGIVDDEFMELAGGTVAVNAPYYMNDNTYGDVPDNIPAVLSAFAVNGTAAEILFDRSLSYVNYNDFVFKDNLGVISANIMQENPKKAVLVTEPQNIGKSYRLFYKGQDTGRSITGAASIKLSPDNITGTWRAGERAGITFSIGLESGSKPVENVSIIMTWTKDGFPVRDGDIRVIDDGIIEDCKYGRYILLNNYKVAGDKSHTVYVVFNSEGFYECTIFAEYNT